MGFSIVPVPAERANTGIPDVDTFKICIDIDVGIAEI